MADFKVTTIEDEDFNGGDLAAETADGGGLSLREAIALADQDTSSRDTITFDESLLGATLVLGGTQLEIEGRVNIDGDINGDDIADITIDGDGLSRILATTGSARVNLDSLTLQNGFASSGTDNDDNFGAGGAILHAGRLLTLTDVSVIDSVAGTAGSGAGFGGGIAVVGSASVSGLTVENSLIASNTANGIGASGGGIFVETGNGVSLRNTTIADNDVGGSSSSFSSTAPSGGGLALEDGTVAELLHTTLTGNRVADGEFFNLSTNQLETVGGLGGGIAIEGSARLLVTNSLIAGNTATLDTNISGEIESSTASILGGDSSAIFAQTNAGGGGQLADNGGTVLTAALLSSATNPAVDLGERSAILITDAAGQTRTNDRPDSPNDGIADAGAFELQGDEVRSLVVNTSLDIENGSDNLTSLREALSFAQDGDTITFDADVFQSSASANGGTTIRLNNISLFIDEDITINGDTDGDGLADVTITGDIGNNDATNALTVDGVTFVISDANDIRDASPRENVTPIVVRSDTNVTLQSLVITGGDGSTGTNTGSYFGGGISVGSRSNLTLEDTIVAGNFAYRSGGGISSNSGDTTIIDSTISGNVAGTGGGLALGLYGGDTRIYGSLIENNTSDRFGGGALIRGETVTISNTSIAGNQAGTNAGGLNTSAEITIISDSDITANNAAFDRGGIGSFGDLTLTNTSVADNSAGGYGGGIGVLEGTLSVTSSVVSNNSAGASGGAIDLNGDGHTLTNVSLVANSAGVNGGAISVGSGGFRADHATLTGNRVTGDGLASGAVYQGGSGQITFTNSLVIGNSAGVDGSQFVTNLPLQVIDDGNNIIGNDDADLIFAQTGTFETDNGTVTFGRLGANGADVDTVALAADVNNAALDNASGDGPAQDARGRDRSDFAGLGLGIADIGAFELINTAPVVSPVTFTVAENATAVGTVTATDDLDTGLLFTISGGVDAGSFGIVAATGALTFNDAPDFEAPADANGDNIYDVVISVSDGVLSTDQAYTVSVTDLDDTPNPDDEDGGVSTPPEPVAGGTFLGNTGDDVITAGMGDDIILDPGGDDTVTAGDGDDRVGLVSGMNTVSGGDGADLIVGGYGNDDLMGDAGMDVIRGDVSTNLSGSDRITGGAGDDLLEGRGGVDTFVFATGDGADTIGVLDIDYVTPAATAVTGPDFVSGVDVVELQGFDLTDNDAALAAVSDVGGVATFAAEGTTITFAGLTVDDLSADDFILV